LDLSQYATALGRLRQAKPIGRYHYFLFNQNFFLANDRSFPRPFLPKGAIGSFADANPIKSHVYELLFARSPSHPNFPKVFQFA
jgi:hypothetical protein